MPPKTPKEVLERAAEVLAERGWCKGTLENHAGNVCANGALMHAMFGKASANLYEWAEEDGAQLMNLGIENMPRYSLFKEASVMLSQAAELVSWISIPDWNDNSSTTGEDVMLAFKRAAGDA